MLTAKQHELLMFIHQRLRETGIPPSFDEMRDALGLKSKSGVHRLVRALEERGFIRRLPHRARAIEIIRLPDSIVPPPSQFAPGRVRGFHPSVIEGDLGKAPSNTEETPDRESVESTAAVNVPVMGRIAAGVPIEAIQDHTHDVMVPTEMLGPGEYFALEVKGDSMIEAGILDGDTVIIKRTESAQNGDIVVALVDNEEATLKRLRRKGGSIALEAANPNYETRIFGPDRVKIQGKLVGLLRRY